jgi:hypothetical protein
MPYCISQRLNATLGVLLGLMLPLIDAGRSLYRFKATLRVLKLTVSPIPSGQCQHPTFSSIHCRLRNSTLLYKRSSVRSLFFASFLPLAPSRYALDFNPHSSLPVATILLLV